MAPPSWVLLDKDVIFDKDAAGNLSEWSEIKRCSTFTASAPHQLEDVTLLARLFDPPSRSKLCIDDHRDMSGSGYRRGRLPVGQRRARVEATDNRVILLSSQSAGLFGQAF
jgi:hypothetical protein